MSSVYENRASLLKCLLSIRDGACPASADQEEEEEEEELSYTHFEWDNNTIQQASGLIRLVQDEEFLFYLEFFHRIFPHADILYAVLQTHKISVDVVLNAVESFKTAIANARDEIDDIESPDTAEGQEGEPSRKRSRTTTESMKAACKEACDIMHLQASDRFESVGHLTVLQLVGPDQFKDFAKEFPTHTFETVSTFYPTIAKEKLKTELSILYDRREFHGAKSAVSLLQFLIENNLDKTFSEVSLLLQISLTTPLVSAEAERCFSTLRRIKTFLRNTMTNERLNALAALSIQKEMLRDITNFNDLVMNKFATIKERRASFLYKAMSRLEPDM